MSFNEAPQAKPASSISVNAKVFVPGASSAATSPAPSPTLVVGGIASSELVKAAPFVPQSGTREARAHAQQPHALACNLAPR